MATIDPSLGFSVCGFCGGAAQSLVADPDTGQNVNDGFASDAMIVTHRANPCTSGAPWTGDSNLDYNVPTSRKLPDLPEVAGAYGVETLTSPGPMSNSKQTTRIQAAGSYEFPSAALPPLGWEKTVINEHSANVTLTWPSGENMKNGLTVTTTWALKPGEVLSAVKLSTTLWRRN